RGVSFDWKSNNKHDIGLIAEEVGQVLPEIIDYEENGIDAIGMSYGKLTPLLVEAVKELKTEIDELRKENIELRSRFEVMEKSELNTYDLREGVK
ncbi:MAG: tail fiber domain-containing protein, partial [Planctomycetota bacterium]